jgi:thiol-disulfide isomerase/thioredoxin
MRARPALLALGLLAWAVFLTAPRAVGGEKKGEVTDVPTKSLKVDGELTADDPKVGDKHVKTHKFKMAAGKTYRIDMITKSGPQLDPYLRLEDPDGKVVAEDDDGGGFPNARIIHKAAADGTYKIIATTFAPGMTGKYLLTVTEAKGGDLLAGRIKSIFRATPAEQKEIVAEVKKHFAENKGKLTQADVQMAFTVASALERGNKELAVDAYASLGKALAASDDKRIAGTGRMLIGAARRVNLPGQMMEVKGKTLDGKDLDWKSYRGKVVLVDFWATWCGPCIAELPNVEKAYKAYHDRGFDVVAISVDQTKEKPAAFVKDRKLPWVCVHDKAEDGGETMSEHYGVLFIPLPILVDKEGRVVSMAARGPELERLLEKYIGPSDKKDKDSEK